MRAKPEEIVSVLREEIQNYDTRVRRDETGTVLEVGDGIATSTAWIRRCTASWWSWTPG